MFTYISFHQLQILNIRYGIDYSLLASSWSPETHNRNAQWSMETSSCDDWIVLSEGNWHLLEKFVRQVTQSDPNVRPKKAKKLQPSDEIKTNLIAALNSQVGALIFLISADDPNISPCSLALTPTHPPHAAQFLRKPLLHLDCHPKTTNPHLALAKRQFKGGIRLAVERTAARRMTDLLLATELQKMTLATHKLWLEDIEAGHYKVVLQKPPAEDPAIDKGIDQGEVEDIIMTQLAETLE